VLKLPEKMDAGDACALLCGYSTSHYALKQRGTLGRGETLCVMGAAGATGIAAIQIGKVMGARVVAVASSERKRAVAADAGADPTATTATTGPATSVSTAVAATDPHRRPLRAA
jgi:NADPH2:quinone reductase